MLWWKVSICFFFFSQSDSWAMMCHFPRKLFFDGALFASSRSKVPVMLRRVCSSKRLVTSFLKRCSGLGEQYLFSTESRQKRAFFTLHLHMFNSNNTSNNLVWAVVSACLSQSIEGLSLRSENPFNFPFRASITPNLTFFQRPTTVSRSFA